MLFSQNLLQGSSSKMYLKRKKVNNVFIHDAARPNISIKLLKRLNFYTKKNKAVVPYINSTNSIKLKNNNKIINLKRKNVFLTQTPQCFNFKTLYNECQLSIRQL